MASAVHKNTETKAASVNVNSVCRQNTVEQGMAAPDEFMAEVQWSMAIRKMIAKLEFGDALKLLMNDRDMSVEKMESESGLSVSTVKRLRAGQEASAEQVVAISVALRLPPMVSSDLLRMCGITLDFNNQRNTVYQMILTGHYKDGIASKSTSILQLVDAPHSKLPAKIPTTEYPWGDWTTKRSGRLFFLKFFLRLGLRK